MLLRSIGTTCEKRHHDFYACWGKDDVGLHFVSKGLLEKEHGKTFSRLFEIRHSGDYDDFVYCDKEMTDEYTPLAKAFIQRIKEILEKNK